MATISSEKAEKLDYVAFFDLDNTLVKAISGKEIVLEAFRQGLMTCKDLSRSVYLSLAFRLRIKDPLRIIDEMAGWTRGIPAETINSLCSRVTEEVLIPSVSNAARDEIDKHKSKGALTVILSSSLLPVCHRMAEHLGIDNIICSELEIIDGLCSGRFHGTPCFGEEKLNRLRSYCEINNNKPSETWYYGDSISDLPAMNFVGHPVCINPDRKLRKKATGNKWEIHFWR